MSTTSIGGRDFEIGTLTPETVKVYPEPKGAYYSLLVGRNRDEQERSIITRGAEKQWGATRVPIWVPTAHARKLIQGGLTPTSSYEEVVSLLVNTLPIDWMRVLLMQMPREGNFVSGLEWNAPGGTQEPGETAADIATREFSEESDLVSLWTGSSFPEWNQFASGCYDEVQNLSWALVTGNPTRLVEGARQWIQVALGYFKSWAHHQNQLMAPDRWRDSKVFCPVDGKVYCIVQSLLADISFVRRQ